MVAIGPSGFLTGGNSCEGECSQIIFMKQIICEVNGSGLPGFATIWWMKFDADILYPTHKELQYCRESSENSLQECKFKEHDCKREQAISFVRLVDFQNKSVCSGTSEDKHF